MNDFNYIQKIIVARAHAHTRTCTHAHAHTCTSLHTRVLDIRVLMYVIKH